jgi:hypothetical protein
MTHPEIIFSRVSLFLSPKWDAENADSGVSENQHFTLRASQKDFLQQRICS